MIDRVGQQFGNYRLIRSLGHGGFADVYLGEHVHLDTQAAVKVLHAQIGSDAIQRFRQEARIIAHLQHPHIVRVLDFGIEGNTPFLVMDYAPNGTLRQHHPKGSRLPLDRILFYVEQVATALQYAHDKKLVHRDVKPENMLLGQSNDVLLSDFGIAVVQQTTDSLSTQAGAGTVLYMAPEQLRGKPRPASDQYALGIVVYEWLSGKCPFQGLFFEIASQHIQVPPPPLYGKIPSVSPAVEKVVQKALAKDPSHRYPSVSAFATSLKEACETSQLTIFVPSHAANLPNLSLPTSAVSKPANPQLGKQSPVAYPSTQPQRRSGMGWVVRSFLLLLVVALIAAALFIIPGLLHTGTTGTNPGGNPVITPTVSGSANGIGVTQIGGEPIGISDGSIAIDTKRSDGTLKEQAAADLKQGNIGSAIAQWNVAVAQDTNDAEVLIYLENQRIARSPHVTYVVSTMLSGDQATIGTGREDLQGAYVAQKEFNDTSRLPNGVKVRLLIANAGSNQANVTQVAQQIVQLAKADKTVVGVMGWPFSSYAFNAVQVLDGAHIPMVSQTASSDQLTGISPYFFRVAPTNKAQGIDSAVYAKQMLHAKNVALFVDNADLYSQSLGQAFSQQFTADGGTIVATESYTRGKPETLTGTLQDALSKQPDLIYFSGYASDLSTLLPDLLSSGAPASLQVLGGDALYELSGYPENVRPALSRLHFTTSFYPDVWDIQGLKNSPKKPPFFADYPNYFDPNRQHQNNPYGYIRPTNHNALAYDAMLALLKAYSLAVTSGKTTVTPEDIQQGLTQINGANSVQGASGKISFDANGNAVNKAVVILYFDATGHIQMDPKVLGVFQ